MTPTEYGLTMSVYAVRAGDFGALTAELDLERYARQPHALGAGPAKLAERLIKARALRSRA